jgi:hypothetical protein
MVGSGGSPGLAGRMTMTERGPLARSGGVPVRRPELRDRSPTGPNDPSSTRRLFTEANRAAETGGSSVEGRPGSESSRSPVPELKQSVMGALSQLNSSMAQARVDHRRANRPSSHRAILTTVVDALDQLEGLSRKEAAAAEQLAGLARSATSYTTLPAGDAEELARVAQGLARSLGACERIAAEWGQLAAASHRLRESVEHRARDSPSQLDELAGELVGALDTLQQIEAVGPSGTGSRPGPSEAVPPVSVARSPLAAQLPTHPCATCGHSTDAECATVAEGLREERGGQCRDCLHECLLRAMPNPSPPGAMVQPNVVLPNVMSPPMPLSPIPDLGPPPGLSESDRGFR